MKISYNPPEDMPQRNMYSFTNAVLDTELLAKLEKLGYEPNAVAAFLYELRGKFQRQEIQCAEVRRSLKKFFPARRPQARQLVSQYRQEMQNWINGASKFPFPPNMTMQKMPKLKPDNLHRYLKLYEKQYLELHHYKIPDVAESPQNNIGQIKQAIEADNPGSLKAFEKFFPVANTETVLREYINESEANALQVFTYIIRLQNTQTFIMYQGTNMLKNTLEKLRTNVHFIRTLYHFIDEQLNVEHPLMGVRDVVLGELLKILNEIGVTREFAEDDIMTPHNEPRDTVRQEYRVDNAVSGATMFDVRQEIPAIYLPVHYNGHRLVHPAHNADFQSLAQKVVTADRESDTQKMYEDGLQYIEELRTNRRYSLDFARVKITEIPGTEDMDIWFHYSHDNAMPPHEIKVEIVVDGASIVYYLDDADIIIPTRGVLAPRTQEDVEPFPDHVDRMYEGEEAQRWMTAFRKTSIHYLMLKYAHALLVLPRNQSVESDEDREGNGTRPQEPFEFSLNEYESQVTIPHTNPANASDGNRDPYRVTVYHGVAGHVRRLPRGQEASPEAIQNAQRYHIHLVPGQTFVRPHSCGSKLTEQGRDGKKIEIER